MFNSNKRKQHIKTLRYSPKCVDCLSPDVSITIYQLPPKHFSQTKLPADGAKILDVRSDELRSPYHCADFFSESYQTKFLYISHLISFCKGFPLTTCRMPHVTSLSPYWTDSKKPTFSFPPFLYRFAPRPRWKCQESQKDLPLLSRTHFLCMATTAKMALIQVKKTCYFEVFGFFGGIFLCRISKSVRLIQHDVHGLILSEKVPQ